MRAWTNFESRSQPWRFSYRPSCSRSTPLSHIANAGGAVLCAIYLASVVASGPAVFIAYWIVALVLIVQALPLLRRPVASSA
jgi:hypothetical protein